MHLLVLGGTHHVGRAVVEAALKRGDEVTTVTRGVSGPSAKGARAIHLDRTDRVALADALGDMTWDIVVDTWLGAPRVVRDSATLLAERVARYVYVSSRSVYVWPMPLGSDESAPVVDADPGSDDESDYAAAKRGAEIAVQDQYGDRALLARAGLILGPYEVVGRLPWWLGRIARGGRVLAPGPRDLPLQYVDGRDLADWLLSAGDRGVSGSFNAVSRPGHTTMGELLDACVELTGSDADLVWTSPEVLESAGISGWTELPIWVPPGSELAGLHAANVEAVYREGLTCRPIGDTVRDTWAWLQTEGFPAPPSDRGASGLDPAKEQATLARLDLS